MKRCIKVSRSKLLMSPFSTLWSQCSNCQPQEPNRFWSLQQRSLVGPRRWSIWRMRSLAKRSMPQNFKSTPCTRFHIFASGTQTRFGPKFSSQLNSTTVACPAFTKLQKPHFDPSQNWASLSEACEENAPCEVQCVYFFEVVELRTRTRDNFRSFVCQGKDLSFFNNIAIFVVISTDLWMSFWFLAESRPQGMDFFAWCWILLAAAGQRSGSSVATNRGDSPRLDNKQICHFRCVFFPEFVVFCPLNNPQVIPLWLLGCPYFRDSDTGESFRFSEKSINVKCGEIHKICRFVPCW